jgi:hypothetical protein
LLEALKAWAVDQYLGEEKMLEMTFEKIHDYFKKAEKQMIRKAGGVNKWNKLSDIKKAERKAKMIEEAVAELGKEAFNDLSDEEQHLFWLFIWAGCGCHKDLNTVVQEQEAALEQGDTPTLAQERAFHKSTCGAIKTAEIAGAIFNHKDKKKGPL